jgi:hypothetical protein
MTNRANAQSLAESWLQDVWIGRETAEFTLRPGLLASWHGASAMAAAVVSNSPSQRRAAVSSARRTLPPDAAAPLLGRTKSSPKMVGPPESVLDLALWRDEALSYVGPADPWPRPLAI